MKKAQGFFVDIFFAVMIFVAAFVILMKANVNIASADEMAINDMTVDGNQISNLLLTEGYPESWTTGDVIIPGIVSDGRINGTKLQYFGSLNYNKTKNMFKSRYDFIFFLANSTDVISVGGKTFFGKPGISNDNLSIAEDPEQVIKISRLSIYDSSVVRLEVIIWT